MRRAVASEQQQAAFNNLTDFLQTFPEINFDLTRYLLSYKYRSYLQTRLARFRSSLELAPAEATHKANILEALRGGLAADVPAYAELSSVSNFDEIPFIDKQTLRESLENYIGRSSASSELWQRETSGTTGTPVPVFYTDTFYFDFLFLAARKFATLVGAPVSDRNFVYCVSVTDSRDQSQEAFVDPTNEVGLTVRVIVEPKTVKDFFALIDQTRPSILLTKPSVMEALIEESTLRTSGSYLPPYVFSMGSLLGESLRADFEQTFGTKVYDSYGLTEFGCVGFECAARNGLHVDEANILIELLDRNGNPVGGNDEGELVLSSLANAAMPLLRYRTGDLAVVECSPCPCGLKGKRITQLTGRLAYCFRFSSGELVSPTHFNNLFSFFPISEFQITQTANDQLQILVEPQADLTEVAAVLNGIRIYVERLLPAGVQIDIRQTRFDRELKFERFRTCVKGVGQSREIISTDESSAETACAKPAQLIQIRELKRVLPA